jgi:hypothetical protein
MEQQNGGENAGNFWYANKAVFLSHPKDCMRANCILQHTDNLRNESQLYTTPHRQSQKWEQIAYYTTPTISEMRANYILHHIDNLRNESQLYTTPHRQSQKWEPIVYYTTPTISEMRANCNWSHIESQCSNPIQMYQQLYIHLFFHSWTQPAINYDRFFSFCYIFLIFNPFTVTVASLIVNSAPNDGWLEK